MYFTKTGKCVLMITIEYRRLYIENPPYIDEHDLDAQLTHFCTLQELLWDNEVEAYVVIKDSYVQVEIFEQEIDEGLLDKINYYMEYV